MPSTASRRQPTTAKSHGSSTLPVSATLPNLSFLTPIDSIAGAGYAAAEEGKKKTKRKPIKLPKLIVATGNRMKKLLVFWILLCSACALVQEGLSSAGEFSLCKFMHAQTLKTPTMESATYKPQKVCLADGK